MYKSTISSIVLHFTLFIFAYYGLPDVKKKDVKEIPIDIVYDLPEKKETFVKETTRQNVKKSKEM